MSTIQNIKNQDLGTHSPISDDKNDRKLSMELVFQMQGILLELEQQAVESKQLQATLNHNIGMTTETILKQTYNKVLEEFKKLEKQQHESFWEKLWHGIEDIGKAIEGIAKTAIDSVLAPQALDQDKANLEEIGKDLLQNLSPILTVVSLAIAFSTGQVELAVVAVGLTIAQSKGALSKLTEGLTDLIAKIPGISKETAKILADISTVIVVAAASAIVGSGVSSLKSMISEETAEGAASQAGSFVKYALFGGSCALASSSLAFDIVKETNLKGKDKEILMIFLELAVVALAIAGGKMSMSGGSASASTDFAKLAGKIQPLVNVVAGGVAIGNAIVGFEQGLIEKEINDLKANINELNFAQKLGQSMLKANGADLKSLMKEFTAMTQDFGEQVAAPVEAAAELLA